MAGQQHKAYQDFVDFLMSVPTPMEVVKYHISEEDDKRISDLLRANQNRRLTDAENAELDDYQAIGRMIEQAKIQALEKLQATKREQVAATK